MPRFRITTKTRRVTNGIIIEPEMSAEVITQSFCNPVSNNGGQAVADAFMRIYGIDIKKAGVLSTTYLNVERVG